jgi:threonine dehydrogenase-like Zn-dependent dehydrogenase
LAYSNEQWQLEAANKATSRVNFGRAPITSVFSEALECLEANSEKMAGFVSHEMPLAEATEGYRIFEKYQARKVVFTI